jgi:glc operon protein GlcG
MRARWLTSRQRTRRGNAPSNEMRISCRASGPRPHQRAFHSALEELAARAEPRARPGCRLHARVRRRPATELCFRKSQITSALPCTVTQDRPTNFAPSLGPALPPPYGPPLSLEDAKRVMAAAEDEAARHGWPMVIAIVDSTGHLVMLHRLDQAQFGSIPIAQQKAETALNFRRPTKVFEDAIAAGGLGLRLLGTGNLLPLDGGLPLLVEGAVVGAIGASGMQSTQDAQVALAGAKVLG